jgi:glycine/D-amino acid oxidase-like deaminating enzyme
LSIETGETMEAAVIGGGITGLFAAYHLQKEGASATLYERGELGCDSVHACGIIEPENFYRTNNFEYLRRAWKYWRNGSTSFRSVDRRWLFGYLKWYGRDPSHEAWEKIHQMGLSSFDEYTRMTEQKDDFMFTMGGLVERYETRKGFEAAVKSAKEKTPPVAYEVREEKGWAGVVFFPHMGWLHTELFVKRMERELSKVNIVHKKVDRLAIDGSLSAGGEEKKFDAVIASTGVACRKLGLPLTAVKGYGWHVLPKKKLDVAVIYADRGLAAVPLGEEAKVTGGWDFDLSQRTTHSKLIMERAERLVGIEKVIDFKSGSRPCSPDGLPVVGRKGNVVAATGGFRLGWSYAPAIGKEAVQLALGRTQNDPFLSRFCKAMRTANI